MKGLKKVLLVGVMMFSLSACSGEEDISVKEETSNVAEEKSVDVIEELTEGTNEEIQYYKIGDTVSTDIFEFTLDSASLTIALSNGIDENYFTAKEYDAQVDNNNPYVAPKGHTYAALTFTVSNLDRASIEFPQNMSVEYKGENYGGMYCGAYYLYQDSQYADSSGKIQSEKAFEWYRNPANNFHLFAGEKETRRGYIDMSVDADSLTDQFAVHIQMPNSDGSISKFVYLVTNE